MSDGALSGLRVLDLTSGVAGPFCTKLLADWGAEVIKIEPPGLGDPARTEGPFPDDRPDSENGGLFHYLNSHKKSVTLDLHAPSGRQVLWKLMDLVDVLVEDLPLRDLALLDLALDGDRLSDRSLVVTSITPFGRTGPCASWRAEEITISALGGMMAITGEAGREPLKLPGAQMLLQTGLHAAAATLAAVLASEVTGLGQRVDISMYQCAVSILGETFPLYTYRGMVAKREGNRQPSGHPHTILPCQDGFVAVLASRDDQWKTLADWVAAPELASPDFSTGPRRRANADRIDAVLLPWLKERKKRDVMREAQAKRLPFGAVFTPAEVVEDPHLKSRSFFVDVEGPDGLKVRMPGSPVLCSGTSAGPGRAPLLGEHTEQVLTGTLKYSAAKLAKLRQAGVV